jgi:hypothetical protein
MLSGGKNTFSTVLHAIVFQAFHELFFVFAMFEQFLGLDMPGL